MPFEIAKKPRYCVMRSLLLYKKGGSISRSFANFNPPLLLTTNKTEKQKMKLSIECYPCLLNQILTTTKLCGLKDPARKEVMDFALTIIKEASDVYPHEIVVAVNDFIMERFIDEDLPFDPYLELKSYTRRIAQQFYSSIENRISLSSDPLQSAVKFAILGNIIDFGSKYHNTIDVQDELERVDELNFGIYDYGLLEANIHRAGKILYLGDNVGEDVFDKALIGEILKEYPDKKITFITREKPIINDVTLQDAMEIEMDTVAGLMSSGSIYPGTILEKTSDEFRKAFKDADLVISKGQGNYETLCDKEHPCLFFLLRAKCEKVARQLDVKLGSMILKKL